MKKTILILILLLAVNKANACDVCGGAVASPSGDVIPGIFSNFIGINTTFRSFSSTHLTLFDDEIPIRSQELFTGYSLQGRYSPVRRVQFLFNVPFSRVSKEMEGETRYASGLSDASMRLNYLVVDKSNDSTKTFFNLFAGSTIKAPTGRNSFRESEDFFFHRNMLPGSGTLDVGFHLDLLWRKKTNGISFNSTIMLRGAIRDVYDFGNLHQARLSAFRFFEFKKSSLMLDLGADVALNNADRDLLNLTQDEYTGGWMLSPSLRVNYFYNRFILSVTAQRPVAQNLAQGQVVNNFAVQSSIIFLLKRK